MKKTVSLALLALLQSTFVQADQTLPRFEPGTTYIFSECEIPQGHSTQIVDNVRLRYLGKCTTLSATSAATETITPTVYDLATSHRGDKLAFNDVDGIMVRLLTEESVTPDTPRAATAANNVELQATDIYININNHGLRVTTDNGRKTTRRNGQTLSTI
ncbi:hypothetical protein M1466_00865 [Candidatus Dependentiae bacterium]|nr:hypothetical protein [Candidatus Dependentiae bacterium]